MNINNKIKKILLEKGFEYREEANYYRKTNTQYNIYIVHWLSFEPKQTEHYMVRLVDSEELLIQDNVQLLGDIKFTPKQLLGFIKVITR